MKLTNEPSNFPPRGTPRLAVIGITYDIDSVFGPCKVSTWATGSSAKDAIAQWNKANPGKFATFTVECDGEPKPHACNYWRRAPSVMGRRGYHQS